MARMKRVIFPEGRVSRVSNVRMVKSLILAEHVKLFR